MASGQGRGSDRSGRDELEFGELSSTILREKILLQCDGIIIFSVAGREEEDHSPFFAKCIHLFNNLNVFVEFEYLEELLFDLVNAHGVGAELNWRRPHSYPVERMS